MIVQDLPFIICVPDIVVRVSFQAFYCNIHKHKQQIRSKIMKEGCSKLKNGCECFFNVLKVAGVLWSCSQGGVGSNLFQLFHMQLFSFRAIKEENEAFWSAAEQGSKCLDGSSRIWTLKTTFRWDVPVRAQGRPSAVFGLQPSPRQQVC